MPGPLPKPAARRRNAPTIPTTTLPVSGRKGRPPNAPKAYELRDAGLAWWRWAWTTPQAAAWDASALYTAARRASLEDDLVILDTFDPHALDWFFSALNISDEAAVQESMRELGRVIGRLKSLAGGRVSLMKEMRELDGKLGLNPEALAKLRWKIVADDEGEKAPARPAARKAATRGHLRAVDPTLAG